MWGSFIDPGRAAGARRVAEQSGDDHLGDGRVLDAETAEVGDADLVVRRPPGAPIGEDVSEGDRPCANVGVGVLQFAGVAGEVDVVAHDDLRAGEKSSTELLLACGVGTHRGQVSPRTHPPGIDQPRPAARRSHDDVARRHGGGQVAGELGAHCGGKGRSPGAVPSPHGDLEMGERIAVRVDLRAGLAAGSDHEEPMSVRSRQCRRGEGACCGRARLGEQAIVGEEPAWGTGGGVEDDGESGRGGAREATGRDLEAQDRRPLQVGTLDVELAAAVGPHLELTRLVDDSVRQGTERVPRRSERVAPRQARLDGGEVHDPHCLPLALPCSGILALLA